MTCEICGSTLEHGACLRTALCKATSDPFDYLFGLVDGTVLRVESAERIVGGWLHLTLHEDSEVGGHPCPRGVDVRISSVAWVADAPRGS